MRIAIDDSELKVLDRRVAESKGAFTPRNVDSILVKVARPILKVLRSNTPVGRYKRFGKGRLKIDSTGDGTYDHGGATLRDTRTKIVKAAGDEVSAVVIGVSKRRGKVGWRTRFITRGSKHNRRNDFIARTEQQTDGLAQSIFLSEASTIVNRILARNAR